MDTIPTTKQSFSLKAALTATFEDKNETSSMVSKFTQSRITVELEKRDLYLIPADTNTTDCIDECLIPGLFATTAPAGENNITALYPSADNTLLKTTESPGSKFTMKKGICVIEDIAAAAQDTLDNTKKNERLEKWMGLPQQKMTPELLRELKALQLRGAADRKRFFKSTDFKKLPTHFHFATLAGNNSKRIGENTTIFTKKKKPRSFVAELLRDKSIQNFTKRKSSQLCAEGASGGKSWYKQQVKRQKNMTSF